MFAVAAAISTGSAYAGKPAMQTYDKFASHATGQ